MVAQPGADARDGEVAAGDAGVAEQDRGVDLRAAIRRLGADPQLGTVRQTDPAGALQLQKEQIRHAAHIEKLQAPP